MCSADELGDSRQGLKTIAIIQQHSRNSDTVGSARQSHRSAHRRVRSFGRMASSPAARPLAHHRHHSSLQDACSRRRSRGGVYIPCHWHCPDLWRRPVTAALHALHLSPHLWHRCMLVCGSVHQTVSRQIPHNTALQALRASACCCLSLDQLSLGAAGRRPPRLTQRWPQTPPRS